MSSSSKSSTLREARSLVVKVGTTTLTNGAGELDAKYIDSLARQIREIRSQHRRVVLVTSGAIRAGLAALKMSSARSIPQKQAAAAVGQGLLMRTYSDIFSRHGMLAAQVLLTRDDVADRERFLNARNTFLKLFELDALPVVNENDTVAVEEIQFGDNDQLASLVAIAAEADGVILLSDVNGLSPARDDSRIIPRVEHLTEAIVAIAKGARSESGTGGMITKLEAARIAMHSGIPLVIAHGRESNVLLRLANGEEIGTFFVPRRGLTARKRWLAFAGKPRGTIIVNDGALKSIVAHGKSLLPVGVVEVKGEFERGDLVVMQGEAASEFARGLSNYSGAEARRIAGLPTGQIARVLGAKTFDELVHRDNLVLSE